MDTQTIQPALRIFTERMRNKYKAENVILFGSYARGDATDYSDVDLIVISRLFSTIPQEKRLDMLYTDSADLSPDFHVFGLTPHEFAQLSPLVSISEAKSQGIPLIV